jgi:hypothetical protein
MAITMKELQYLLVPYGYNSRVSYDWPIGKELMVEMVRRFQQDQDAQVEIDIDLFIAYLDADFDDDFVDAPACASELPSASPEILDGAEEAELALAIALSLPSKRGREEKEVDNIIAKYARL